MERYISIDPRRTLLALIRERAALHSGMFAERGVISESVVCIIFIGHIRRVCSEICIIYCICIHAYIYIIYTDANIYFLIGRKIEKRKLSTLV